jgi:hypothetical protein
VIPSTSFSEHASFLLSQSLSALDVFLSRGNSPQHLSVTALRILWQMDVSYTEANENTKLVHFMRVSFAEEFIINIQGSLEEELEKVLKGSGLVTNFAFV